MAKNKMINKRKFKIKSVIKGVSKKERRTKLWEVFDLIYNYENEKMAKTK